MARDLLYLCLGRHPRHVWVSVKVRFGLNKIFRVLLAASLFAPQFALCRTYSTYRGVLAIDPPEQVLWSNTLYLTPPPERDFYDEFIGSGDQRVINMYESQWATYSMVRGTHMTETHYDHTARLSLYSNVSWEIQERQIREGIAQQTFRIRVDESLQNYLTHPDRSPELNKVRRAFESIRDSAVSFGEDSDVRAQMRMGYDLASDSSHAELSVNEVAAGIYHPRTTAEAATDHPLSSARVSTSARFDNGTKGVIVDYPLTGETLTTTYFAPIARGWAGSVSTTQPLRQGQSRDSYNVVVTIDF